MARRRRKRNTAETATTVEVRKRRVRKKNPEYLYVHFSSFDIPFHSKLDYIIQRVPFPVEIAITPSGCRSYRVPWSARHLLEQIPLNDKVSNASTESTNTIYRFPYWETNKVRRMRSADMFPFLHQGRWESVKKVGRTRKRK